MIKLYGSAISNYYCMAKVFMLEKGFDFEEIYIAPTYSEPFLELSPMGKIPCIEVDEGYLSETTAILGFLESCVPEVPMMESDGFRRAQMAQLIKVTELYIGIESARLNSSVFFGGELNQAIADSVKPTMERGVAAFNRLTRFSPYLLGSEITIADFFAYYTFSNARIIAKKIWGWDLVADIPGLREWVRLMSERPMIVQVNKANKEAMAQLSAG
ncbi:MAG: glutathione S-transferase family protein [Porticoccaceae bacterium]|nr:glutathione S-transferase family protein [Porticoccaceae bacterium]